MEKPHDTTTQEQSNKPRHFNWKHKLSLKQLNSRYHFLMSHEETMEPIVDFRLNLLNLFFVVVGLALLLVVLNTCLIAFTPLREYIPGYTDSKLNREVYLLNRRADSLALEMQKRDIYFSNLQHIIEGYDFAADSCNESTSIYEPLPSTQTDTIRLKKTQQASLLRAKFESESQHDPFEANLWTTNKHNPTVKNFFAPLNGKVVKPYNPTERHFGIDVTSNGDQIIKATLDGTVVFATWSIDNGYSIGIQHDDNYFSTYKHNATLLKKEGDYVKAGEAIAVMGESGNEPQLPHLHFELWHNGTSVNPTEYMAIEKNTDN